ncbi:ABC transporter [bacterium]|nr:ABC transporter [bacterium]MBU1063985.1 ABC transporter [bacterium]MBU1634732.1 ABC transporter [bacterium]MBU1874438.1 ABC transporter [bacterium]
MRKFITLALADLKNVSRDSFLILIYCIPVFIALLFRFATPVIADFVVLWVDLTEHYAFIVSFLAFLTPSFVGMVMGFMLLDERDEDILSYMAVTPLTKSGYMLYRIVSPVIISFIMMYVILFIAHLTPIPVIRLIPVGLMASMEAPMLALFLAAFANNKVEGLAVYKLTSMIFLAPFVGYFVKSNWAFLAGILPPFWVSKAFLASFEPFTGYWLFVTIGFVIHGIFIYLMLGLFNRRIS